jgi:hypothetical protein
MLAAGGIDIADAFSTDLYTGTSAARDITNGIDLSGEGGMVWFKSRSNATNHYIYDTARGGSDFLSSNSTNAESTDTGAVTFNSDGYTVDSGNLNYSSRTYVAWTFRKAPKFFDVVTWTGDGVAGREIAHDLGQEVGMILVKRTNSGEAWFVYHRSLGAGKNLSLNFDYAASTEGNVPGTQTWYDTPTDSGFYVGSTNRNNGSGSTYVAYLFAHDTEDDSVIQCGSYTGNGSATGPVVTLGWEPQWLMIKRTDAAENWFMFDNQRSTSNSRNDVLYPNRSDAESSTTAFNVDFNTTGFQLKTSNGVLNGSGGTYIYMAIRKEGA